MRRVWCIIGGMRIPPYIIFLWVIPLIGLCFAVAWLYTGDDKLAVIAVALIAPPLSVYLTVEGIFRKIYGKNPDSETVEKAINKLLSKQ